MRHRFDSGDWHRLGSSQKSGTAVCHANVSQVHTYFLAKCDQPHRLQSALSNVCVAKRQGFSDRGFDSRRKLYSFVFRRSKGWLFCFCYSMSCRYLRKRVPSNSLLLMSKAYAPFGPNGPKNTLGNFVNYGEYEGRLRLFKSAYGTCPLIINCFLQTKHNKKQFSLNKK